MKICNNCDINKELNEYEEGRNTCRDCRRESRKIHNKICGNCKTSFKSAKKNAKYCSAACVGLAKQKKKVVKCEYCGTEKEVIPSLKRRIKTHYCNQRCRTEHMKITMKGDNNPNFIRIQYSCDGCGENINIIPSRIESQGYSFCSYECYKENIGQYFSGENASNWNHGLTIKDRNDLRRYPAYYKWRSDVYERDKYTCQKCRDDKGGNLIAHHIYNYSEHYDLRTVLNNGITLCDKCHRTFHMRYGYKNNNKQQLNDFIDKAL